MPPWITALLALLIVTAFGAYVVFGEEGFDTARTLCNKTFSTCTGACSSTDSACRTKCGEEQTKCLSNAVAAATVLTDGPLNRPYMTSNMAWAAALGSGLLGNSNASPYMQWKTSAGSSTAIPSYSTDISRVYRPTASNYTFPSPISSPWDGNRDRYVTGWPQQTFDLENEDSYDATAPSESSYFPNVRRWKPHEVPMQEAPGLRASAPTDAGTMADDLRDEIPSLQQNVRDDIDTNTLQGLIREDVKETIDALFKNHYEIKYT